MSVSSVSGNYFQAIANVTHCGSTTSKEKALTGLALFSLITGVIPIGFAFSYCVSSCCCKKNISHQPSGSSQDQRIQKQANEKFEHILIIRDSPHPKENLALAKEMVILAKDCPNLKQITRLVFSDRFLADPLMDMMKSIYRGTVNECVHGDEWEREFLLSHIPQFAERVCTADFLRRYAFEHFKNDPQQKQIMAVLEELFKNSGFQENLRIAIQDFNRDLKSEKPIPNGYASSLLWVFGVIEQARSCDLSALLKRF